MKANSKHKFELKLNQETKKLFKLLIKSSNTDLNQLRSYSFVSNNLIFQFMSIMSQIKRETNSIKQFILLEYIENYNVIK